MSNLKSHKMPIRIQAQHVANLLVISLSLVALVASVSGQQQPPPRLFPTRRNQGPTRAQPQAPPPVPTVPAPAVAAATGSVVEVPPPVNAPISVALGSNRTTRTADVFQNGDGYNIVVTNTCERENMRVNVKMSRPFYGVIHTRGQRQKAGCTVEGSGEVEYNLDISHVLNEKDPAYCGVIRARRESPEQKDTLSVVVAVRFHRNIELSDDKFFLLNCTNRCRRPDCSSGNSPSAKLTENEETTSETPDREGSANGLGGANNAEKEDECTIYKFPWAITLMWCLGILLLASMIAHCIMCSSFMCRCVRTEVEEREPSVFEDESDLDGQLDAYNKKRPHQIEYDNRNVYKTSNNYQPYNLEEAQQAETRRKHRR